ncbi:MAG: tryptophanase [Bryobacteraceae bacterium]|nr:tryptophanase [Bryobacterales bacterium]MEB2360079.1 tryptophanase [Bryobacterales bacterium]NUN01284.1 tryptophanase [Bryobacteraceae bacterium]
MSIRLSTGIEIPIEMHKVRIVQKVRLLPVRERLRAIEEAGYNTFLLRSRDLFLDMLTDSGTNAMTDNQQAAMMQADDAYAGSESFYRLEDAVREIFGYRYVLPAHQGRAAEHLLAKTFLKPGNVVPMNYHFTTTKAHFELAGASVRELFAAEALNTESTHPFKGNIDIGRLKETIDEAGPRNIPFVRMEATTNLLGGQPFSLANLREIKALIEPLGIPLVVDGSLISENAYFIRQREEGYAGATIKDIILEIMSVADLCYLSGRKSCSVRGGLIATNRRDLYEAIRPWLPVYEGFFTYGGMSSKEVEAMAVGMREMTELDVAGSSADAIKYFANRLIQLGLPIVTPPGGLACHLDATRFIPHVPQEDYPAGALAAAVYIASGIRGMERGTVSMDRDAEGRDVLSDLELVRLAVPRRVFTMSHFEYAADRLKWLHNHRDLIGALGFCQEPPVLRFFAGRLKAKSDWPERLASAFEKDFGPDC